MRVGERVGIAIMSAWGLFAVHQGTNALMKAHNWQPLSASDWGTWAGAVGTVATLVWTVRLATAETRRREKAELVLARLHASALLLRIERASNVVNLIRHYLNGAVLDKVIEARFFAWSRNAIEELDTWDVADLVPLVPLANEIAPKLAQVTEQLSVIKRKMKDAGNESPSDADLITRKTVRIIGESRGEVVQDEDAFYRLHMGRDILRMLTSTKQFLEDALHVCQEASRFEQQSQDITR